MHTHCASPLTSLKAIVMKSCPVPNLGHTNTGTVRERRCSVVGQVGRPVQRSEEVIEGCLAGSWAEGSLGAERDDVRVERPHEALGLGRFWVGVGCFQASHEVRRLGDPSDGINVLLLSLHTQRCAAAIGVPVKLVEEQKVEARLVGKDIAVVQHQVPCKVGREGGGRESDAKREQVRECADEQLLVVAELIDGLL